MNSRSKTWKLVLTVVGLGCFGLLFVRPLIRHAEQARLDTALVLAIRDHKTEEALTTLQAGANPNARGNLMAIPGAETEVSSQATQFPALMIAAFMGNTRLVKALVDKGADVNARMAPSSGAEGYTALMYAVFYSRDPEMVKTLLAHGADFHGVAQDGHTPLSVAESLHYDKVVRVLKQAGEGY